MKYGLFFLTVNIATALFAQKKVIDHTVYDQWKTLGSAVLSDDGRFVTYEINPHKGDGYLYIYNVESDKLDSISRGAGAQFSGNGNYIAFRIKPHADSLRKLELDKVDKKKWPKDTLGIYHLGTDSLSKYPNLKSFELSEGSDWALIQFDNNDLPEQEGVKIKKKKKKKKGQEEYKSEGKLLAIYSPTGEMKYFKDVKGSAISNDGKYSAFFIHKKVKADSVHLVLRENLNDKEHSFSIASTDIQQLVFDRDSRYISYLSSADTAKQKNYALNLVALSEMKTLITIDSTSQFVPSDHSPSTHFKPIFTIDGRRLFFGLGNRAEPEVKDTLLEDEKAVVDVWHYKDDRLQPQQLKELKRDQQLAHIFVYELEGGNIIALTDDTLRFYPNKTINGNAVLASSNENYQSRYNWEYPWKSDYYRLDLKTGERILIGRGDGFNSSLSPDGQYYLFFAEGAYHMMNVSDETIKPVSSDKQVVWTEDMNGMPADASNFGVLGWTRDGEAVVRSRHNVYTINSGTAELNCVTCLSNDSNLVEIDFTPWESDSAYLDLEDGVFVGFDTRSKGTHVYQLKAHGDHNDLVEIAYYDAKAYAFSASRKRNLFAYRKMTVSDYPELYVFKNDIKKGTCISVTNPQQNEYIWPTVELIEYTTYDGNQLEGLLYKPENFDPAKQYPLLVYYYELYTDRYHQHYIPKPTASIIYPTEYASAGYVVLIPDIRYESGHPARSAYNTIMAATDRALELYPNIDSTRIGLQGQSWGGYQTAQMITMTDRYAAAMAGAPVSNMFSAYGGIRWGSGLNRQFQYEKSQSRIGATIWETPELYYENSPIFGIPKITTPLLIMHNDGDGAVPWYQGIEMFTAMKRLNKPVWMLNYNNDDHNLMKDANRRDLSVRMRQFFDHYLQGKPAPKWLIEGVPAIEKGIDYGLEYIENDQK